MERVKYALAQARAEREKVQQQASSPGVESRVRGTRGTRSASRFPAWPGHYLWTWLAPAAAAILIGLLFGWLALGQDSKQAIAPHGPEDQAADMNSGPRDRLQARSSATDKLQADLGRLQAHVDLLLDSVNRLDRKLMQVEQRVAALNVIPGPGQQHARAAPTTAGASAGQMAGVTSDAPKTKATTVRVADLAAIEAPSPAGLAAAHRDAKKSAIETREDRDTAPTGIAASEPTQSAASDGGIWVINLASLPDQPAANRFAARAHAKQVNVETIQATVKGKTFWRVRAGGFASREDARAAADSIETRLGIKESWISRRQLPK
jgi:cell division septation protein DedD